MIQLGNFYYFMYMILSLAIIGVVTYITQKQSKKVQKTIILGILFSGFILHFLKLVDKEYYNDLPYSLRKVSFENICAVSTLIFPFIFLTKSNKWKDYMYCFGILGGLGVLVYPNPAVGHGAFSFETIRCYYCHLVLILSSILMVKCEFHKLDYHRLWKVPFTFFEVLVIILFNEIVLMATGLVEPNIYNLLDRGYRNSSFIFGPTHGFDAIKPAIDVFVPKIFRVAPCGPLKGEELYWPIIWMVLPAYVVLYGLAILIYLPFEKNHMKDDFRLFKQKLKKEND